MAERILIQDTVSNVSSSDRFKYGYLTLTCVDYRSALESYLSDISQITVKIGALEKQLNSADGDSITIDYEPDPYSNIYIMFHIDGNNYEITSQQSSTDISVGVSSGTPMLEDGWALSFLVEAPEEESFLDKIGFTRVWNNIKSYIDNREPAIEVQGDWHYRIYNDNSFEAWYGASGVTFVINSQSGNLYKSDLQTLTLPTNLTNQGATEIISFDVGVGHNNYPVFSTIANMSNTEIKYYVMSGSTRNSSPNYKVSAYVYGLITRN